MYKPSMYNLSFQDLDKEYYYNTLSGELIKVDANIAKYIADIQSDIHAEKHVLFEPLYKKGFIVNANLNEYNRIKALNNELLYSSQTSQASYVIALTTACNYQCTYCYEEGSSIGTMHTTTATEIVEFICGEAKRNNSLKTICVTWFGGEPLLEMELIEYIGTELLNYCQDNSISLKTNIITNGYLLNAKTLEILNRFNLDNIQITLDGQKEYYDYYKRPVPIHAFETVMQNIRNVTKTNKLTIRLNCALDNYQSLLNLCNDILEDKEINADNIYFSLSKINMVGEQCISVEKFSDYIVDFIYYLKKNNLTEQIIKYLPEPRVVPCGLMKRTNFVIDHEGFLYKCEHYVGKPQFSVGNVHDGLLYPPFQSEFEDTPFFENCDTCSIFPLCRGGCSQKRFIGSSSVACEKKKKEIMTTLQLIIGEIG